MTTVLFGVFGVDNYGNEASLTAALRALGAGRIDDVVVAAEDPDRVRAEHGVRALAIAPRPRAGLLGRARAKTAEAAALVRLAWTADRVIVPGTGIAEGAWVEAGGMPFRLAVLAAAARLRGRPLRLASVGVDEAGSAGARMLFGLALRLAGDVSARDAGSVRAAGRLCGRRVREASDLAFALTGPSDGAGEGGDRRFVAVGTMDYAGSGARPDPAARRRYEGALAGAVGELAQDGPVRLFCGAGPDEPVALRIRDKVLAAWPGADVEASRARSYLDAVAELAGARCVLAARYHTMLAALTAGAPVVGLAYAPKHRQLLDRFGLRGLLPIETFEPSAAVAAVRAQCAREDADRPRIAAEIERLRAQALVELDALVAATTVARRKSRPQ